MQELKFDVMDFVIKEDRSDKLYSWYKVDPSDLYPLTIQRMIDVIESGDFPDELVDNNTKPEFDPRGVARTYLQKAKIFKNVLHLGFLKFHEVKDNETRFIRSQVLTLARQWFTQSLHVQIGGDRTGLGIHITKDESYKL